jgi:hypothetical protein
MSLKEKKTAAIFCNLVEHNGCITMPSLESQEAECRKAFDRFVNEKSITFPNEEWILLNVFAAEAEGEEVNEVCEMFLCEIVCGHLDAIFVHNFNCLAGSIVVLLQYFREILNLFGCKPDAKRTELITVKEGLDTTTTLGQDALVTLAAFTEFAVDDAGADTARKVQFNY